MQYTLVQKIFQTSEHNYKLYNNVPFIFKCFMTKKTPSVAIKKHHEVPHPKVAKPQDLSLHSDTIFFICTHAHCTVSIFIVCHYYIYFEAKYVLGLHIGSFPLASSSSYRTPSVAAALIHILTSSPLLHNIRRKSNGPRKDEFHTIYYSQTKNYTTFVHIAVDPRGCGSGTYVHASTALNASSRIDLIPQK